MNTVQKRLRYEIDLVMSSLSRILRESYGDRDIFLDLRDFLITFPIRVQYKTISEKEWKEIKKANDPFGIVSGYVKLEKSDFAIQLAVNLVFNIPDNITEDDINTYLNVGRDALPLNARILFVYLHELQHVLQKHWQPSFNAYLDSIVTEYEQRTGKKFSKAVRSRYFNIATDFYINGYLLGKANSRSDLYRFARKISDQANSSEKKFVSGILYHPDFDPTYNKNITVKEILLTLLKHSEVDSGENCVGSCASVGEGSGQEEGSGNNSEETDNGSHYTEYKVKYKNFEYTMREYGEPILGNSEVKDAQEIEAAARSTANQIAQKLKGTGSAKILSELGAPIEVTVDWLSILVSKINVEVKHITDRSITTWQRLKNKYRHIAHLPTQKYYDSSFACIISIDQSGSMDDVSLRKINYVINKLKNKASAMYIIIHDSSIVDILEGRYATEIEKIVSNISKSRFATGGTSHHDVFEKIVEIAPTIPNTIYISFSDNYSDIEENISIIEPLANQLSCYWVMAPDGRILENVPGIQIDMETGKIF